MKYREERTVRADDGEVEVELSYGAWTGRFTGELRYSRTIKGGDIEQVRLVLPGLTPAHLRCIASSLHGVMDEWSNDWHKTNNALKGEE